MIRRKDLTSVKDSFYGYPQTRYIPLKKADLNQLTAAEKTVLDSVVERLSDKSAKWLCDEIQPPANLLAYVPKLALS
jgi:hypothetical protein